MTHQTNTNLDNSPLTNRVNNPMVSRGIDLWTDHSDLTRSDTSEDIRHRIDPHHILHDKSKTCMDVRLCVSFQ